MNVFVNLGRRWQAESERGEQYQRVLSRTRGGGGETGGKAASKERQGRFEWVGTQTCALAARLWTAALHTQKKPSLLEENCGEAEGERDDEEAERLAGDAGRHLDGLQ